MRIRRGLRRRNGCGGHGGHGGAGEVIRRAVEMAVWRRAKGRWVGPALGALLVLVLGVAALRAGAPPAGVAHASGNARTVARWYDPEDGTSLTIQLLSVGEHQAGDLTFGLANGDVITMAAADLEAAVPGTMYPYVLDALQNAPADVQLTPTPTLPLVDAVPPLWGTASIYQESFCVGNAQLQASGVTGAQSTTEHAVAQIVPVTASVALRLGTGGLTAYAGVSFGPNRTACEVASTEAAGPEQYNMFAGCTYLICIPPPTPAEAVQRYDAALEKATSLAQTEPDSQLAQELLNLVRRSDSTLVRQQYSQQDFVTMMQAQVRAIGVVTAISDPTTPPDPQFDAVGQTYFTVTQTVTLHHNGTTSTEQVTSYYLLEGGDWKFWFSADARHAENGRPGIPLRDTSAHVAQDGRGWVAGGALGQTYRMGKTCRTDGSG